MAPHLPQDRSPPPTPSTWEQGELHLPSTPAPFWIPKVASKSASTGKRPQESISLGNGLGGKDLGDLDGFIAEKHAAPDTADSSSAHHCLTAFPIGTANLLWYTRNK